MQAGNDYHKYFIVDGRHVGDYEAMYRECADPWRIEELGMRLDMRAALLLAGQAPEGPIRVLDAGCGAGLLSLELWELLARTRPGSSLTISDISPTAVAKASERILGSPGARGGGALPVGLEARPFDLRLIGDPRCPWPDGSFGLILMAQVLWGLVENLGGLFGGLARKLGPDGLLVMSQHFPGPGRQGYAPSLGPDAVLDLAGLAGLRLLHTLETDRATNHHWAAAWTCG
ncbi:MAG: methyltransferase domain-containing protein [Deltaproteobacteria bacterium]|nr:methyltransferase domain-containing protein [Deltaproteobacteria bacterium]